MQPASTQLAGTDGSSEQSSPPPDVAHLIAQRFVGEVELNCNDHPCSCSCCPAASVTGCATGFVHSIRPTSLHGCCVSGDATAAPVDPPAPPLNNNTNPTTARTATIPSIAKLCHLCSSSIQFTSVVYLLVYWL